GRRHQVVPRVRRGREEEVGGAVVGVVAPLEQGGAVGRDRAPERVAVRDGGGGGPRGGQRGRVEAAPGDAIDVEVPANGAAAAVDRGEVRVDEVGRDPEGARGR